MKPKDKEGKLMYHLFPVEVHEQVIQRFNIGAEKYGEDPNGQPNWRKLKHKPDDLLDAVYRHIAEYRKGNKIDPENGSPHLVAAITNLVMLQDLENKVYES